MKKKVTKSKRIKKSKQVGGWIWNKGGLAKAIDDTSDFVDENIVKPVDNLLKKTKIISSVVEPALTFLGATAGTAIGTVVGGPAGAATGGTIGTAIGEAAGGALKDYAKQHGYGNKFHNNILVGQSITLSHLNQKGLGAKTRIRGKHMQRGGGTPFLNPVSSSYGGVSFN